MTYCLVRGKQKRRGWGPQDHCPGDISCTNRPTCPWVSGTVLQKARVALSFERKLKHQIIWANSWHSQCCMFILFRVKQNCGICFSESNISWQIWSHAKISGSFPLLQLSIRIKSSGTVELRAKAKGEDVQLSRLVWGYRAVVMFLFLPSWGLLDCD